MHVPLEFTFLLPLSLGLPCLAAAQQDDWVPSHEQSVELAEDIQDVPSLDLRVDEDPFKRAFLIGLDEEKKAPRGGYGVIVVLPGSHWGPSFASFVHRIHKHAVPGGFLTLQLVAPEWKPGQHDSLTWVTERSGLKEAEFTTEVFVNEALAEVARRTRINKKKIFSLSWSSGGPPANDLSLQRKTPLSGSVILMSVFYPSRLPSLSRAKGYRYYLMQSPEDKVTHFSQAEKAKEALEKNKAEVHLESYEGGHAFPLPVYPRLATAFEWLQEG
ncbi:MAG: hypothetical protein CMJ84_01410 [Planctomycetes bacterium]|jgi:predicted esterase|nr:hypothetical protein [Planctomycetota bacterium]MDP6408587.1 hypothetical protein [Planctomycetota bacterium]